MAKRLGVGKESVRRWVIQAQVDGGTRAGVSTEESEEIKRFKGENRRLRAEDRDFACGDVSLAGELDPRNR